MADISGIRGMLLEEAILYLLRVSGYRTLEITTPGNDPTIHGDCYSGLKVLGRGGVHQIDAIADFTVTLPFSYPHRLLVEAKCYSDDRPIGIEFVRNAVGVLKDVGEFWVSRGGNPQRLVIIINTLCFHLQDSPVTLKNMHLHMTSTWYH